jgi:hypothetical protein
MFDLPYLAIKKRILDLGIFNQIDLFQFQYVPDDNGAIFYDDPACFIEFSQSQSSNMPDKLDEVKLNFRLHTVSLALEDGDDLFKTTQTLPSNGNLFLQANKAICDYAAYVSDVAPSIPVGDPLDKLIFGPVTRTSVGMINNIAGLIICIADYTCLFSDFSRQPDYEQIVARLRVTKG